MRKSHTATRSGCLVGHLNALTVLLRNAHCFNHIYFPLLLLAYLLNHPRKPVTKGNIWEILSHCVIICWAHGSGRLGFRHTGRSRLLGSLLVLFWCQNYPDDTWNTWLMWTNWLLGYTLLSAQFSFFPILPPFLLSSLSFSPQFSMVSFLFPLSFP